MDVDQPYPTEGVTPRLAPEVIEMIISHADDFPTLLVCSLVSKLCLHPARANLFYNMAVIPEAEFKARTSSLSSVRGAVLRWDVFIPLLGSLNYACRFVKELRLSGVGCSGQLTSQVDDDLLSYVISRMPELKVLELYGVALGLCPVIPWTRSMGRHLPTAALRRLTMRNISGIVKDNIPARIVRDVLSLFSTIDVLQVDYFGSEITPDGVEAVAPAIPQAPTLTMPTLSSVKLHLSRWFTRSNVASFFLTIMTNSRHRIHTIDIVLLDLADLSRVSLIAREFPSITVSSLDLTCIWSYKSQEVEGGQLVFDKKTWQTMNVVGIQRLHRFTVSGTFKHIVIINDPHRPERDAQDHPARTQAERNFATGLGIVEILATFFETPGIRCPAIEYLGIEIDLFGEDAETVFNNFASNMQWERLQQLMARFTTLHTLKEVSVAVADRDGLGIKERADTLLWEYLHPMVEPAAKLIVH